MRLRLNRYYRFGYIDNVTGYTSSAYSRYVDSQADIDECFATLRRLEGQHPGKTFWFEESMDGNSWAKLNNNRYALFSED